MLFMALNVLTETGIVKVNNNHSSSATLPYTFMRNTTVSGLKSTSVLYGIKGVVFMDLDVNTLKWVEYLSEAQH